MKELVIVSQSNELIIGIEQYIKKNGQNNVTLVASVSGIYNKLGICYNERFDIFRLVDVPLKRYFKDYKRRYFEDNVISDKGIISRFVSVNINREYNMCFGELKSSNTIYVDSAIEFLTKELKYSWDRIIEIIGDNFIVNNKSEVLFFDKDKNSYDNNK